MAQEVTADSSLIGQTFDNKFRVTRLIGRGGMGEVFEAEHIELGKRVAVKLMLEKYNGDREAIQRFKREALAASRIGDPHITDVIDIGTAPDGRAYVVMELLEGQPLSRLLETHGQLPSPRALRIMRQVLRAVGAAHAKGIVHRDLKPDNIFLQQQGEDGDFVKLLDFGISKIIDPELQAAATKLTTTGVVMGTPLYMAPEQAMGTEVDHHADIYACGVMFYEMMAGRPPFEGHTYAVLVAKLLTTDPPLLTTLRDNVQPKLVAAIHRALEKDPAARFDSCDQFLAALPSAASGSAAELAGTLASGAQVAVPVSLLTSKSGAVAPTPSRSNILIVGATLAGIAVATLVIVMMQRSPSTPTKTEAPPAQLSVEPIEPPVGPAWINLAIKPPEAKVTILGKTYRSGEVVTVVSGTYDVRAELAGYQSRTETIVIADHETRKVELELAPVVARPEPTPIVKPVVATKPGKLRAAPTGNSTEPPPPPPVKKEPASKPAVAPPSDTGPRVKPNPYMNTK